MSSSLSHAVPLPLWIRLLVAAAAVKVLAGAAASLAITVPADEIPGPVYLVMLGVFAAVGACLLVMGRADRRAVSLGVFFLLVATSFAVTPLSWYTQAGGIFAGVARFVAGVNLEAFQPWFLWMFARDFPRTRRVEPRSRIYRMMVAAALAVGIAFFLIQLALAFGALRPAGPLIRWLGRSSGTLYWPLLYGTMVPAVFYSLRQARRAPPDEQRRVWMVVAAIALGTGPILLFGIVGTLVPAVREYIENPANARMLGYVLIYPSILLIPVLTAYAVLAERALVLSDLLRRAVQHAAIRQALNALAALPFAALMLAVYAWRGRSVADVLSGPTGLVLVALGAAGVVMLGVRRRLLASLDRRFLREPYDSGAVLAALTERARAVRTSAELAAIVEAELGRPLHLRFAVLLLLDPATGSLASTGGVLPPLDVASALARRAAAEPAPLDVERSGWLDELPAAEREWVRDGGIHLLVPLLRADGTLAGVLAFGEKQSELPYSAQDLSLLTGAAAALALAVEARGFAGSSGAAGSLLPAGDADVPAPECGACGRLAAPGADVCERCGSPTEPGALPSVLGGKFRVLERLGSGGMGVVYRGVDLSLGRDVAIKTLPFMGPREARWLRKEARAMAAVAHPNLAAIFGAESWHGLPLLVVEYLPGGTLADRLRHGRMEPAAALDLVNALVPALARLHAAAILHRDIKPSNIGFAADGTPRLLDFGLARAMEAAQEAEPGPDGWQSEEPGAPRTSLLPTSAAGEGGGWAGTLLYLPPEAVNGEAPAVSWDLWALCMVLYEAIAGRHPLEGGTTYATLLRIAEAEVPDLRESAPQCPPAVAELLRDALHLNRRKRPATAAELGERLHALRESLRGLPVR